MAQRFKDEAGNIWEMGPNGQPSLVSAAHNPGLANPKLPGELTGQTLENKSKEAALAKTPYEFRAEAADAAKKELDLKVAREQYDAQHPSVSSNGLYGDDYLKTLSDSDKNMVKALSEGRLAFPQGAALRAPFWQEKLSQVAQFDPTFDATNFNARAQGRVNAIKGKLGQSNNALNTAIGHLGQLSDQISGTASHNFTPFNAVENAASKMFGGAGVTNFQDTAAKLADELESVYRNGGGAEQGVTRQLRSLDPNMSLEQKQGIVQNAMDLLASKMAANLSQYNFGTGGKPTWDMLDPHTLQVLHQKSPGLLDKYFAAPQQGGNGPPPTDPGAPPPPINGGPQAPNAPNGGIPHADYSSVGQGPNYSVAQQGYRQQYDPQTTAGANALIHAGKSYDEVKAYAASRGYPDLVTDRGTFDKVETYAKSHPDFQAVAAATKPVPTTAWQRFSASPAAAAIAGSSAGATAGLSDVAGRALGGPAYDANRDALAATHPYADLAGNVAGGTAGMFAGGKVAGNLLSMGAKGGAGRQALALAMKNPVATNVLGDTAYGSAYGASENPDDPLSGAALGAVTAPFASLGGQYATKAIGAGLHGVTDPAVQRLRAAGIPLTVGEVLGGGAKKAQDAMTSVFGPGNMVSRRYGEGRQALNQAAFDQAGQIVNTPINAVGQKGIQALDAAKSRAYSSALDPVSLDLNNPDTISGLRGALGSAQAIPNVDQATDIAKGGLQNYIGNAAPGGVMAGPDFQQAYRGLSRLGRQSSGRIYGHEIGQALGQGQDALVSTLESQNPGAYGDFLRANSANRHLSVLSDAVNSAKNQIGDNGEPLFTPAQLGTAASSNARTYSGKLAAASGERPFNQLATDAQKVMSSKLPESGTFPRQLMGLALTGGLSGAGGMFGGEANGTQGAAEEALVPLSLLTMLGTRRGQKLLTAALANRSAGFQGAGQMLARNPQVGGDILTAAGIPLLAGR